MRKVTLFLVISGCAASAVAQWEPEVERRLSPAYNDCQASGDAARGVTSAMMSCLGEENERQDARLNQAYRMVMNRLPTRGKAKLRQSQRAWIKSRDADARTAGRQVNVRAAAAPRDWSIRARFCTRRSGA